MLAAAVSCLCIAAWSAACCLLRRNRTMNKTTSNAMAIAPTNATCAGVALLDALSVEAAAAPAPTVGRALLITICGVLLVSGLLAPEAEAAVVLLLVK